MATLYGPSDVQVIQHGNHRHAFPAEKREAAPGFGNTERSLPTLDCSTCAVFLQTQGWRAHPGKVTLTADEQEYERDSERQGSMNMRLASEAMGAALARMAMNEDALVTAPAKPARKRAPARARVPARAR